MSSFFEAPSCLFLFHFYSGVNFKMSIIFSLIGFFCFFVAFAAFLAFFDVVRGRDKIKANLLEFKDRENNRLRPVVGSPRTGRITGGLTPGKGMTYVPSDDLVDSI